MDKKDNKHEKTEYNDIESLAAFLHSGKMQEESSAGNSESSDLDKVLFNIENRNRTSTPVMTETSEPDFTQSSQRRKTAIKADPSIPANPLIRSEKERSEQRRTHENRSEHRPVRKKQDNSSFFDKAKKMIGAIGLSIAGFFSGIKNSITNKNKTERKERPAIPERPKNTATNVRPEHHARPIRTDTAEIFERAERSPRHERPDSADKPESEEIPALAASLSAALGEKAAEIVEQNKNELPPEDIPEVFDIEEGSAEEEEFDNTATRLMNAVNDPQARSVSMKDEVEEEEEEARAEKIMAARLRLNYERQKQSTRTLAYILIALLLCAAILGAAAYASTYIVKWALDFSGVASQEFQLDITIPDDADIETVSAILAENSIINDAKFFKFYADLSDKFKKENEKKEFIGGKYTVSSTMSYSTLLSILRTKVTEKKTVSVRIVEGMTAHEIAELLEENNVCFADDFEKYYKNIQNNYDFERRVKENSQKFNQLEGYLFPDTYEFYIVNEMETGGRAEKGQTSEEAYEKMKKASEENALEAAKKMYSNFNSKITRSMYKKMGEMHLTLDETMALASMVQREAASEEDMGNVASVFLNRIRNSAEYPYLQSDVTVLYVENDIKPYITGSEALKQRIYDSYNTYTCKGIPAGAVCNPGISAINAVLYAPETPYYYFCANKDTGEIYYAETKEKHEENLVLAGLTAGEQSSPEPYGEGSDFE